MKYVIEIEDKKLCEYDKDTATYFPRLWKAKGFNALVFDQIGIDKLTPLDKELEEAYQRGLDEGYNNGYSQGLKDGCHKSDTEEYQQGLNDAWEAARKITGSLSPQALIEIFGNDPYSLPAHAIATHTATEAIAMIKTYEQQKADAEIKVGDEVEAYSGRAIVFGISTDKKGNKYCQYWYPSSERIDHDATSNLRKTGRYFPQVGELIRAIKEGAE